MNVSLRQFFKNCHLVIKRPQVAFPWKHFKIFKCQWLSIPHIFIILSSAVAISIHITLLIQHFYFVRSNRLLWLALRPECNLLKQIIMLYRSIRWKWLNFKSVIILSLPHDIHLRLILSFISTKSFIITDFVCHYHF